MKNIDIIKRLYNDYTTKHLNKIILAIVFSILVAGATSATAWLLDPAIEKIFFISNTLISFFAGFYLKKILLFSKYNLKQNIFLFLKKKTC